LINDFLAARHFAARDPIGELIRLQRGSTDVWRVVGVVANVKNFEAMEPSEPQVYVPFAQSPERDATVILRVRDDPAALAPSVRSVVAEIDPAEPIADFVSMTDRIDRVTAPYNTISAFVTFFGIVTLLLSAVGLYGVVSYSFAQRTREIGIRMALGARRSDVAGMVLAHLRTLLLAGVVPGLLLAWLLAQSLKAILFGVTPGDWRVYLAMAIVLTLVSLAAIVVPARRATAINPTAALRYE
jgi:putative ABC transport system permease protein